MAANQTSLEQQAETIRDETGENGNTATRIGTFMRELMSWLVGFFVPTSDYSIETDLGTNATQLDVDQRYFARAKAVYTGVTPRTLTLVQADNLVSLVLRINNTAAKDITLAGATFYFNSTDLPAGLAWNVDTLSFPADNGVKYNLFGNKIDGVFDCKIEIR